MTLPDPQREAPMRLRWQALRALRYVARVANAPSPGPHKPWPAQSPLSFSPLSLPRQQLRKNFPADNATSPARLEIREAIATNSGCDCLVREFVHQRQIRSGIGQEKTILRD